MKTTVLSLLIINSLRCNALRFARLCPQIRCFTARSFDNEVISSHSNKKIQELKRLQSNRGAKSSNDLFLEGFRQIKDAIQSGLEPRQLFVSEELRGSSKLDDFIRTVSSERICYTKNNMLKSLSDTVHNQGVVAKFAKPPKLTKIPVEKKSAKGSIVVVLDGISDPGNMGTLLRTSLGFAASAVVTVGGCNVWSPKVVRSSMGACLRVPIVETSPIGIKDLLSGYWKDISRSSPSLPQVYIASANGERSVCYYDAQFSQHSVLVIGSEAFGVSEELFQTLAAEPFHSNVITVPSAAGFESFNAATAGAIILSEICRQINCFR